MVTDLRHLLDLPPETPGPARRLAEQLGNIVRAATAGHSGFAWETALPCRRRPANRACAGRMIVELAGLGAPVQWQCSACGDDGAISNWEDSPFDLRPRRLAVAKATTDIILSHDTADTLRDLRLLTPDEERLVFRIRAHRDHALLAANEDDLEELIGSVAAEANHEQNRKHQRRLDAAFDALNKAAEV